MTLSEYIKANGLTVGAFAARADIPRNTIHKIVYGQRQPSLALAERIVAATDGDVTHQELLLDSRTSGSA